MIDHLLFLFLFLFYFILFLDLLPNCEVTRLAIQVVTWSYKRGAEPRDTIP